jgi:hypothetical protein
VLFPGQSVVSCNNELQCIAFNSSQIKIARYGDWHALQCLFFLLNDKFASSENYYQGHIL